MMELKAIAADMRAALDENRANGLGNEDILDLQALCVAEEAGEVVGAYRRWAGKARRSGTLDELSGEIADLLIVTAVFAERLGIDIDQAVTAKLRIIYTRGWSQAS